MKILYPQTIPVSAQTLALGGTVSFQVPRESLVEGVTLYLEGTVGTAAATAAVEGLSALIKSVSIRGSMGSGPTIEPINGISGPSLYEIHQFQRGSLPAVVGALGSTGVFRLNLPIWFREWFFSSQLKNLVTAIPAYQMSDFTVTVQIASQAEVDVNVVPTFALGGTPRIGMVCHQYYRDTIPQGIPFVRSTYENVLDDAIVTGSNREIKLPAGNNYSLLLLRSYSAANTRQATTGTGPINCYPAGAIRIYDLSRYTKAETDFNTLRQSNLEVTLDALVPGNGCFLFNRGESNLFQTGALGQALNNVLFQYQATAAAGAKVEFLFRRILDDANVLGIPQ